MKKIIVFITIAALVFSVLPGCKKILEVKPESNITEENYFKNEGDFEPYVAACAGVFAEARRISCDSHVDRTSRGNAGQIADHRPERGER